MPSHNTITDPNIHEPKGASTASAGQVYVADGLGSGAWTSESKQAILTIELDDISTASTSYAAVPFSGTIDKIYSVLHGAISGSDAAITTAIDGVSITNGSITVAQSGSAAGDLDSATPSANKTVSAGSVVSVATDGASTGAQRLTVTFLVNYA